MNGAFFYKGKAKVTLNGYARIVTGDGEFIEDLDLSTLGEVEIPFDGSVNDSVDYKCNLEFKLENIFEAPRE